MSLTGPYTVLLAVALALAAPLAALALWNRTGRGAGPAARAARWATRGGLLLLTQLTAVMLVAVVLNDANRFYSSWLELLGDHHTVHDTTASPGRQDGQVQSRLGNAARGHGVVVRVKIPDTVSHVGTFTASVYLPAAYGLPQYAHRDFPVVELIAGSPGTPDTWTGPLHVARVLDSEIAAGRTEPLIAVMPTAAVDGRRDTQCVDIVGGPAVETYLARDVRAAVVTDFRADPAPSAWAVMGYSSGGFCATNLAMRNPDLFAAAVSVAGYDRPAHDSQTGNLFGHDTAARDANTPIWRAEHLPPPDVSVLLMSSKEDPETARDARALAAAARAPFAVTLVALRHGGHNFEVWRAEEPVAFAWISARLTPPLAPAPVIDRTMPVAVTG